MNLNVTTMVFYHEKKKTNNFDSNSKLSSNVTEFTASTCIYTILSSTIPQNYKRDNNFIFIFIYKLELSLNVIQLIILKIVYTTIPSTPNLLIFNKVGILAIIFFLGGDNMSFFLFLFIQYQILSLMNNVRKIYHSLYLENYKNL